MFILVTDKRINERANTRTDGLKTLWLRLPVWPGGAIMINHQLELWGDWCSSYLEVHGTALVAHPVRTFNTLLACSASIVARLTLLVWIECLVVKELLESDEEDVALHGTNAAWWNDTLGLAEWTEKRLTGADL